MKTNNSFKKFQNILISIGIIITILQTVTGLLLLPLKIEFSHIKELWALTQKKVDRLENELVTKELFQAEIVPIKENITEIKLIQEKIRETLNR